jgi:hypothetical protein
MVSVSTTKKTATDPARSQAVDSGEERPGGALHLFEAIHDTDHHSPRRRGRRRARGN